MDLAARTDDGSLCLGRMNSADIIYRPLARHTPRTGTAIALPPTHGTMVAVCHMDQARVVKLLYELLPVRSCCLSEHQFHEASP